MTELYNAATIYDMERVILLIPYHLIKIGFMNYYSYRVILRNVCMVKYFRNIGHCSTIYVILLPYHNYKLILLINPRSWGRRIEA